MSSIIDADGNINSNYLTKELQQALEEDVKYKQTDNMKKRAVKVSTDYNEFKAMVACAHLKKLTPKEVESLSHVKKGWQKTVQKDKSSAPVVLTKEIENEELIMANTEVASVFKTPSFKYKPKSAMEIERDLRRQPGQEAQLLYLLRVGLKRAKPLLCSGADTDLLETIIRLLTYNKTGLLGIEEAIQPAETHAAERTGPVLMQLDVDISQPIHTTETETAPASTAHTSNEKSDEELLGDLKLRVKWFKAICEFDRFDLTKRFLSKALLEDVVQMLNGLSATDVAATVLKYSS